MADTREKLIELLEFNTCPNAICNFCEHFKNKYACEKHKKEVIADNMIANGFFEELQNEAYDLGVDSALHNHFGLSWEDAAGLRKEVKRLQDATRWIPVTERLPENEVDVLICAERRLYGMVGGERKTVRVIASAFHTDGKMNTEDSGYNWELDNVDMDYDEEADAYIVPEGWWESVRYGEEFSSVDDFVTHWMPLPTPPKGDLL